MGFEIALAKQLQTESTCEVFWMPLAPHSSHTFTYTQHTHTREYYLQQKKSVLVEVRDPVPEAGVWTESLYQIIIMAPMSQQCLLTC